MRLAPEWIAIGLSALALGISGVTAYEQFWPSDETKAIVSHASFRMGVGRFGRGPILVTALSIVNRGNRPVILSRLTASYGYNAEGEPAASCDLESGQWAGLPWDTAMVHGEPIAEALPRAIMPKIATAMVYTFEPSPIRANSSLEQQALMACLAYELINSEGEVFRARSPIGVITFTDERIEDVTLSGLYRDPVTIIP